MILILSASYFEYSTDQVIDWLKFKKANFKRINGNSIFTDEFSLFNNDEFISEINIVWNRRWFDYNNFYPKLEKVNLSQDNTFRLMQQFFSENVRLSDVLQHKLKNKRWLSKPEEFKLNRVIVSETAKKLKLDVPESIITNSILELKKFINNYEVIITKSIAEMPMFMGKQNIKYLTSVIDKNNINNVFTEGFFYPSLFQEKIEKKYEIRTFYLDNEFYSMAIFSQENNRTKIDYRNYDTKKPNRFVPYNLPRDIEEKLRELVNYYKLSTCSIDIIKALNDKYYFLEINPVGQFGMVSYPCNYNLEEKIADYLIRNDK